MQLLGEGYECGPQIYSKETGEKGGERVCHMNKLQHRGFSICLESEIWFGAVGEKLMCYG